MLPYLENQSTHERLNDFKSPFSTSSQPLRRSSSRVNDEPAEVTEQKRRFRYKQGQSSDNVQLLRRSSDSPEAQFLAYRVSQCNRNDNLFVAADLHNSSGECFTGRGNYWACRSRFCSNCAASASAISRRKTRYGLENMKLQTGENWYFNTFTMPDEIFRGLSYKVISDIQNEAWKLFTHCEKRESKSNTWYQNHFRGGFKSPEFTYSDLEIYHNHIHALMVGKSTIQNDKVLLLRFYWTKALKKVVAKRELKWNCPTGNKHFIPSVICFYLASQMFPAELQAAFLACCAIESLYFGLVGINVQKVTDKEKAVKELCKYITKNDSWAKLPAADIESFATMPRLNRGFEAFGECRELVREMKKSSAVSADRNIEETEIVKSELYLDTKQLKSDSECPTKTILSIPKPTRRKSWRVRCREIPLWQYKVELENEIEETKAFRQSQLRLKYPLAVFKTLEIDSIPVALRRAQIVH